MSKFKGAYLGWINILLRRLQGYYLKKSVGMQIAVT
jgi:hypothetical protein